MRYEFSTYYYVMYNFFRVSTTYLGMSHLCPRQKITQGKTTLLFFVCGDQRQAAGRTTTAPMTSSSSADSGGCVVGRPPASASASSFPVRRLASIALVVMAFAVSIANVMIGHRDASSSSSSSAVAAAPSSAIDKPRRSISRIRQRSEEEGGGGPIEEGRRKAEDDDDRRRSRVTGGTEESDHHHHHRRRRRDENDDDGLLVVDGDLVTRILLGEVPFPSASGSGSGTRGSSRIRYLPGTLRLSHAEALRRCYVNETIYSGHLSDRPQSLVSLSDEHKLIYRNNPKSSSSSARHAMVSNAQVCHPPPISPILHCGTGGGAAAAAGRSRGLKTTFFFSHFRRLVRACGACAPRRTTPARLPQWSRSQDEARRSRGEGTRGGIQHDILR